MKRSSPVASDASSLQTSRCTKRRSMAVPSGPLSPPQSRPVSPAPISTSACRKEAIQAAQQIVARELNAVFELEYKQDIVEYMDTMQEANLASSEMMDLQPELEWYMRPFLLDFLIEVHAGFRLQPTTLHLAINIIDRYTSRRVVFKKHYQLLGCTALWIAAKYEEAKDKVPTLAELRAMCCDSYPEQMFLQMEGHVLKTLNWTVGTATTDGYLQISLTVPAFDDTARTVHLARMCSELALFHREFVPIRPSIVADGCLAFARQALGQQPALLSRESSEVVVLLRSKANDVSTVLGKKYAQAAYEHVSHHLQAFLAAPQPGMATSTSKRAECQVANAHSGPHASTNTNSKRQAESRNGHALPQRIDVAIVTPVRTSHVFTHGMITPPAEGDCERYAVASHFGSDGPSAGDDCCYSPASSILDAYRGKYDMRC
ncbi:hypothetical protein PYCC9005_000068 [Savitreella phatthalungensis]